MIQPVSPVLTVMMPLSNAKAELVGCKTDFMVTERHKDVVERCSIRG
jgi:hypothetical protein